MAKMTYAAAVQSVLDDNITPEVKETMARLLTTLLNRAASSASRSHSPKEMEKKAEAAKFREKILARMEEEPDKEFKAGELAIIFSLKTQQITPSLTALVKEGKIERIGVNRDIYFKIAPKPEEEAQ